jgi:hypothetical protein
MADYEVTLKPITNRTKAPIALTDPIVITGVDTYAIIAGWWFDIPNCWELIALRMVLTTDATVANRNILAKFAPNGSNIVQQLTGDDVAASTTVSHYVNKMTYKGDWNVGTNAGFSNEGILLHGDGRVTISVDTGKAGDTLSIRSQWKWKNWDYGMDLPYVLRGK